MRQQSPAAVSPPASSAQSAATTALPTSIPDTLDWPSARETAVTYAGAANVTVHGTQRPEPIASLAKVMTAYIILTDHPLADGAAGPTMTVTPAQAAQYAANAAEGQSVLRVESGEKLTERQALEELMLRSANNLATLLAAWDAGSVPAFLDRMNRTAAQLSLTQTTYADPAGVDRHTVSTATDQVRLGLAALNLPGFAQIVALARATVPVVGTIYNDDAILGVDGIIGIKTGYTTHAGGTMLVAARTTVNGRVVLIVGALMGVPGGFDTVHGNTLVAGERLIRGAERSLSG
jgi:D-alanyl-D-alanine carboxypeptidase (penicillin-binding protein 5/6)